MDDQQNNIIVSISCLTYNHAQFIRQCLDGFLMQECDFAFEVLIHDDASTDGTIDIIKEYQQKHPQIIKPFFQSENQWSKGVRGMNQKFNYPRAKGKYIALCEGDDYWIDPLKLQKQVGFLENRPNFSMIFSNAHIILNDGADKSKKGRDLKLIEESKVFSDIEIFEDWTIPTASVLFRRSAAGPELYQSLINPKFLFGDIIQFLYLTSKGKIYGLADFTVCYRKHGGGVTQIKDRMKHSQVFNVHILEVINIFGTHLKTKKIKTILSRNYMYTSLSHFKMKNFKEGIIAMRKSIFYDYKIYLKYILTKISFIAKRRHT